MSDIVTKKGETAALLKRADEWMALMPMQSPGPQHLVLDLADALRAHISLVERQRADPFAVIPNDVFWIAGKGVVGPNEPLYGIQLIDPNSARELAVGEADTLAQAIVNAVRALAVSSTERLSGQR